MSTIKTCEHCGSTTAREGKQVTVKGGQDRRLSQWLNEGFRMWPGLETIRVSGKFDNGSTFKGSYARERARSTDTCPVCVIPFGEEWTK